MYNEWQSVLLEIVGAVLTASFFVAQCVTQEAARELVAPRKPRD